MQRILGAQSLPLHPLIMKAKPKHVWATMFATPLDYTSPTANMYGCQPCPHCGSVSRWPNQDNQVICDDCGLIQPLEKTP